MTGLSVQRWRPDEDIRAYRRALGVFPTGVAVVSGQARGRRVGMTVNSFTSVSLEPALVLWSVSKTAPSLSVFREATHFAVNVLSVGQCELSRRFCTPAEDKFAGLEVEVGAGGAPLLGGTAAWFECRRLAEHEGGDHFILVGEVEGYANFDREPLVFCRGSYGSIGGELPPEKSGFTSQQDRPEDRRHPRRHDALGRNRQ